MFLSPILSIYMYMVRHYIYTYMHLSICLSFALLLSSGLNDIDIFKLNANQFSQAFLSPPTLENIFKQINFEGRVEVAVIQAVP